MNKELAKKRYKEVLRVDVINNSEEDFLATHEPMKRLFLTKHAKLDTTDYKTPLDEEKIFQQVVIPTENDQFVMVKGSSGTGKSHLIRWFYVKLKGLNLPQETILFIKRDNNTLKGTLRQLLEVPEIQSLPNRDQYKKLLAASQPVPEKELKEIIYHNYLIKIESDTEGTGDNSEERMMTNVNRKQLIALMQDESFKAQLMEADGPIDRIYAKFDGDVNKDAGDLDACFQVEDFAISDDLDESMENNGDSRRAARIAHRLWEDQRYKNSEQTRTIVHYLNTFNESVIQRCSGLEPGDLRDVFTEIRKELAKQGRNLTLMIEDISSFTGVNAALIDALTTKHTGMYEQTNLCRVNAIVGCTDGYFQTSFRDNFKERIDYFITVPDEMFTEPSQDLIAFFARYLNTISLDRQTIHDWSEKEHADMNTYPVHTVTLGEGWDEYELPNGSKINLFPFTKNAIVNLYNMQDANRKKPRALITEIILPWVQDALGDLRTFPRETANATLPYVEDQLRQNISRAVDGNRESYARMLRFMAIWGTGKSETFEKNGKSYISGICEDVYSQLGMPLVKTKQVEAPTGQPNKVVPVDSSDNPVNISNDQQLKPPIEKKPEIKDEHLEKARVELDRWITHTDYQLDVSSQADGVREFNLARNNMDSFLLDSIDWDAEGISNDALVKFKTSSLHLVSFERQARGRKTAIVLPATNKTQNLIEAFIRYSIAGNNWGFPNGNDYLLRAEIWARKLKPQIVSAVMSYIPKKETEDQVDTKQKAADYFKFAVIADYYRLIVNGACSTVDKISELPVRVLLTKFPSEEERAALKLTLGNGHTISWKRLQDAVLNTKAEKCHDIVLSYYNLIQGTRKSSGNYEIDYYSFHKAVKSVIQTGLVVSEKELQSDDPVGSRAEASLHLNNILSRIHNVVEDEKKQIQSCLDLLSEDIDLKSEGELRKTLRRILKFYETADKCQIPLTQTCGETEKKISGMLEITELQKTKNMIALGQKVMEQDNDVQSLLLLSRNPLLLLKNLTETLQAVKNDLKRANTKVLEIKRTYKADDSDTGVNTYKKQKDILAECRQIYEEVIPDAD